ncbi:hypothetical protein AVEN_213610-1 [Araneus ventricosus]|uniref:Uncharacterized protein n=1 Tax=Araneus ventricosus TaxID=182803 RepID=A0A4Y2LLY9_ARAVE|nr:hypothetical protein AVEN_213610-1 [Araneus ventricosus]
MKKDKILTKNRDTLDSLNGSQWFKHNTLESDGKLRSDLKIEKRQPLPPDKTWQFGRTLDFVTPQTHWKTNFIQYSWTVKRCLLSLV